MLPTPTPAVGPQPQAFAPGQGINISSANAPGTTSVGGILTLKSLQQTLADEKAAAVQANTEPVIQGLAGHVRKCWTQARMAKEMSVEPRMLKSLRQRRGEYDPDMTAQLREQNSTMVYMMLTSNKCRSAAAWLRDVMDDMPWTAEPSPVSDLDPQTTVEVMQTGQTQIQQAMMMGYMPSPAEVRELLMALRDQAMAKIQELAKQKAERMTLKMKDQLEEGGFQKAFDDFIDDLVTFPSALLKGPVVRKRPRLKWSQAGGDQPTLDVTEDYVLEWERVDPFMIYPAPDSSGVDDSYLIERHRLSREELDSLRDVEGYSKAAINAVLEDYGRGGLHNWLAVDVSKAAAEGKATLAVSQNPSSLIDALQFWGSVQGQMLVDWGLDKDEIEDPLAEYHVEIWLIGHWVIKATVNPDPLHRKPYYMTSWECVPGAFWGNSIPDLCRDTQSVCNAAARALVNNMSLASGPQVVYNVSRLPDGENLTNLYPWKIWQVVDDPMNTSPGSVPPVQFFQPASNAQELMAIYEKFSNLADEYTGIPRYMTGDSPAGGAGRTASGMSMLMSNAGKSIKNVVASVDRVLEPAIGRLYFYNMRYLDDAELKGDVNIVARGATALMQKEAAAQRLNEFLTIILTNPIAAQVIGQEGIAVLMREAAKRLELDTDEIIPALPILKARWAAQQQVMMQQQAQMQQDAQQSNGQAQDGGTPPKPGSQTDQRQLMNGAPQANAVVRPQ